MGTKKKGKTPKPKKKSNIGKNTAKAAGAGATFGAAVPIAAGVPVMAPVGAAGGAIAGAAGYATGAAIEKAGSAIRNSKTVKGMVKERKRKKQVKRIRKRIGLDK